VPRASAGLQDDVHAEVDGGRRIFGPDAVDRHRALAEQAAEVGVAVAGTRRAEQIEGRGDVVGDDQFGYPGRFGTLGKRVTEGGQLGAGGRVGLSGKHVLALSNRGNGTTDALLALARQVRDGVKDRFGVDLLPEPVLVGCAL